MEGTRWDRGRHEGGERGRFGGGKSPSMMGVKCSAKERPRSRRTVPFCLSRCFARRALCILRTEVGGIPWSLRGPHGEPGRVYSARNTQDARNYGLSIISYASRYLLNIVPAYFSGEFACRGKRVSSKGGGEGGKG